MPSDDETLRIKRQATVPLFNLDGRVYAIGLGGNVDTMGHPTGELAIWVITLVAPLVPAVPGAPPLRPIREVIPPEINGVKTHVIEFTESVELHGKRVAGGSRIRGYSSAPGRPDQQVDTGTLGIAARTVGVPDHKRPDVLLSCHHVLGEQPGGRVVQLSCSECCEPDVARVLRGDKRVDASIATINDDWEVDEGKIDGVELAGVAYINPLLDWSILPADVLPALKNLSYEVHKYGAETGWTNGLVGCVDVMYRPTLPPFPPFSPVTVPVILISSTGKDASAFSKHGDSGAVVIDGERRVVALLFAGQQTMDGIGFTWAVPIWDVQRVLNIRVAATSASTWGPIVTPTPSGPHHALAGTASGRELLDMYGRHEPEVRALLQDSRSFVVAWHRGRGPDLVRALTEVAERRTEALPSKIAGRSWADLVGALAEALRGLGSPGLVRDLDRIAPLVAGLGGRTYGQVLELVAGLEAGTEAAP